MAGIMTERNAQEASPTEIPPPDNGGSGAGTRRTRPLAVDVRWRTDSRSAVWDEVWRRILYEVLQPDKEEPPRPLVKR